MDDFIKHWTLAGLKRLQGLLIDFMRLVAREPLPTLPADRPLRRWSSEELERVKTYLESERSEPKSFDDQMLAVEWIHQTWWPADEVRTVAQWEAAKATYAQRIRHAMAFHGPSDLLIELEARRRQDQLFRAYRLSLVDFERLVIPVVLQHPCAPYSFDDETVDRLWRTISPNQFVRRDALEQLSFWPVPLDVTRTAEHLGSFAQRLLAARAAGHQTIKLEVSRCRCRADAHETLWTVDELLRCLEDVAYPVRLHSESRCANLSGEDDECRTWCSMSLMPMDHARQPPVDPTFERVLDEIAERHRAMWAQQGKQCR
ncbi:hypothetical protein GCM10007933_03580 [Zoogloea oryzae]|uniref:Uncharacterized protein n=1 Tax=Zoogloea oryzae TaxID=310767 RepID=A0ABQ6F7L0_9RHOO|nr:hypothetical protein [Zoogloea oryzae]GLT20906.1 hypothetical protein GCM10007933_03580 [Zoogloea oryzae]